MPENVDQAPLKKTLLELVSASQIFHASLWVDGIYTPVKEAHLETQWINGHEIYFKIEGRIDTDSARHE